MPVVLSHSTTATSDHLAEIYRNSTCRQGLETVILMFRSSVIDRKLCESQRNKDGEFECALAAFERG